MKVLLTGLLLGGVVSSSCVAGVHTWHNVETHNGKWLGRLVITSANQGGYFFDESSNKLGSVHNFRIEFGKPFTYGFGFDYNSTDFNVAYSVTLYQAETFSDKACVYTVTASGPGQPDIRINAFNGANCQIDRADGSGTNFLVN